MSCSFDDLGTNTMDMNNKPLDFDGDNIPDGDLNNSQSWMDKDDDNDGHLDTEDDYPFDDERWKKENSNENNEYYWSNSCSPSLNKVSC